MLVGKSSKKNSTNKKRPLSGNPIPTYNSLSILDNEDIVDRITDMGVPVSSENYESINLLKELEHARNLLTQKNEMATNSNNIPSSPPISEPNQTEDVLELLDWEDDTSHVSIESHILSTKRIRKPPRRLSFSVSKKKKGISKRKACNHSQLDTMDKGNPGPTETLLNNKKIVIK